MSQVYSLRGSFSRNLLGFGRKKTVEVEGNEAGDAEVEDEQQMDEPTRTEDEDGKSPKDGEDDVKDEQKSDESTNDEDSESSKGSEDDASEAKDKVAGGESSDESQDEVTDGDSSDEPEVETNDNSSSSSDEESQDKDSGYSSDEEPDSADPMDNFKKLAGESSNNNDESNGEGDEGDISFDDDFMEKLGNVGSSFDLDKDSLASSFEYSEDAIEVLDHDTGGETNIFAQNTDLISIGSGDESPPVQMVILMGGFLIYLINRRNEARKHHRNCHLIVIISFQPIYISQYYR
jgi:hypothetical protein